MAKIKLFGYIYKIVNNVNGKLYIGKTTKNIEERFQQHLQDSNKCTYLKHAIKKYGKERFSIEAIFACFDEESLNTSEQFFIEFFRTMNHSFGYNLRGGGAGGKLHESLNTNRPKLPNRKKPSQQAELYRLSQLRKALVGKKRPDNVRRKISIKNSKPFPPARYKQFMLTCQSALLDRYPEYCNRPIVAFNLLSKEAVHYDNIQALSGSSFTINVVIKCLSNKELSHKYIIWFFKDEFNSKTLHMKLKNKKIGHFIRNVTLCSHTKKPRIGSRRFKTEDEAFIFLLNTKFKGVPLYEN